MRILLINPPYQTLTSNVGVGHQVPLGLLMVGGALLDTGHEVRLLDAEGRRLTMRAILSAIGQFKPDLVMTGHAGSTPAHPICLELLRTIRAGFPNTFTVYGGVYPSYHAREILLLEPAVDVIVRGEGEATTVELVEALQASRDGNDLGRVAGIACRCGSEVVVTPERPPISDLDVYRVGWELIEDWSLYGCFGLGRAAIVQFSRGCPHRCTYCGQHGFWVRWRYRDPVKLADEIEWLYRRHNVRFHTLADENPTTLRDVWQAFLEELASRQLPVHFFATIRATDIVRDADLLPLYRRAGILYILMGIESTDGAVLRQINKGSTPAHDVEACRLLRQHGIFSVLGHIVGFGEETTAALRAVQARLIHYEGDWLNAMYVTPHDWTPFGQEALQRELVELDQRKWDYRHQVLAQKHLKPWQLFARVKWLELWFHLRPARLWRMLRSRGRFQRRQIMWVLWHTGMVWACEVLEFLRDGLRTSRRTSPRPEAARAVAGRRSDANPSVAETSG
ncbi:MAG TPA: radical SAM protein [Gemmataceae bacterium]|nr:radical SAM protein [Gemmataceae bacterium]